MNITDQDKSVLIKCQLTLFDTKVAKYMYWMCQVSWLRTYAYPTLDLNEYTNHCVNIALRIWSGRFYKLNVFIVLKQTEHKVFMNTFSCRIVANNLYPFAKTIAKPDVFVPEAIEQIDIGKC